MTRLVAPPSIRRCLCAASILGVLGTSAQAYINGGFRHPAEEKAYHDRKRSQRLRDLTAVYKAAIERDPTDAVAYYQRGRVCSQHIYWEEALADFNEAIRLDPKFGRAYCRRAQVLFRRDRREAAFADFERAVEHDPEFVPSHLHRALAYIENCFFLRDEEAQKASLRKAVESAERACALTAYRDAMCLQVLTNALARLGEFEEAVKWQTKVVSLLPLSEQKWPRQRLDEYQRRVAHRGSIGFWAEEIRQIDRVRARP
jgi:tetratricopeptide (TPR) repeat protein